MYLKIHLLNLQLQSHSHGCVILQGIKSVMVVMHKRSKKNLDVFVQQVTRYLREKFEIQMLRKFV